ncbi:MAG TPA: alpha/beta fold hydrolase [Stellaceae bacterium]|jgi:homoserine O-acetyltransferase|nr:alpha/beta fold hydrolase [Stellaceae bacterium]
MAKFPTVKEEKAMPAAAAAQTADIGAVEDRNFPIRDFRLQNGEVMPEVNIAYETYGRLAADGRNAVLVTHGYTSSHHAAGQNPANANQPGWWDGLIGPGKAIDTDRLYVVASNMLGSSFGSTNGASLDPRTGKPYGADFPAIAVRDIVAAQKALLDNLGVRHLVAVAGPSYGGYQAFQWAVAYPLMMDAVAAVVTAPRSQNAERSLAELQARLATDPEWHGGHYYGRGAAKTVLEQMRFETLMRYGYGEQLAARFPDKTARERAIRQLAADWARNWDANSLVILRRATIGFDTVKDFAKIRAKILYVLCRTDVLFPPTLAPGVIKDLAAAGVDARYFELDSDLGHSASGPEHAKWSPVLREFLAPYVAALG